MVVVDSSALIPLAWVGQLELGQAVFQQVHTTIGVRDEVVTDGQRGAARLGDFLEDATVHPTPTDAEAVADLEGISTTDAAVVLLADRRDEPLLANDKALLQVARSHGVDDWWVTTLLLKAVGDDHLASETASDVLYDLVDEGMNLSPKVYTTIQRRIDELGR